MNTDQLHDYPAPDYSFFSPYTTRYDRPDRGTPVGSVLEDWDDDEDDDYTDEGQFNF